MHFLTTIALGVAAFVATNLDDVFLLLVFFADPRLRARDVVLGQYAGIGALVVASLALAIAARAVDPRIVGLLGLAPIALGLRALLRRGGDDDEDAPHPLGAWAVAAVTVANGGDNLGVYVPLFAAHDAAAIATMVAVFVAMVAVWLAAARGLVAHPTLGPPVRRAVAPLVPWVLIGLGAYILLAAGTFAPRAGKS